MATNVQICNLALRGIGAKTIVALDSSDTSKESQVCQDIFAMLLDEVLDDHPWNFAKVWVALAEDAGYTFIDDIYEYAYQMPSGFIRMSKTEDRDLQYEIRGEYICSNEEDMEIEYIQRMDDPAKYPSHFVRALASRLRPELSASIKTKFDPASLLRIYYELDLPRAMASDARLDNPSAEDALRHTNGTDTWISART